MPRQPPGPDRTARATRLAALGSRLAARPPHHLSHEEAEQGRCAPPGRRRPCRGIPRLPPAAWAATPPRRRSPRGRPPRGLRRTNLPAGPARSGRCGPWRCESSPVSTARTSSARAAASRRAGSAPPSLPSSLVKSFASQPAIEFAPSGYRARAASKSPSAAADRTRLAAAAPPTPRERSFPNRRLSSADLSESSGDDRRPAAPAFPAPVPGDAGVRDPSAPPRPPLEAGVRGPSVPRGPLPRPRLPSVAQRDGAVEDEPSVARIQGIGEEVPEPLELVVACPGPFRQRRAQPAHPPPPARTPGSAPRRCRPAAARRRQTCGR